MQNTKTTTIKNLTADLHTPLYVIKESDAKLHITKGNNKIGKTIYSFSTLPGNQDHMLILNHSILLTDIPGTCSKYCDNCAKDGACYAWRDAKLHHNVTIKAWGENTLLLRAKKAFDLIDDYISKKNKKYEKTKDSNDIVIKTFRINVSGEVESCYELEEWEKIAQKHPEVMFGLYTKNYEALEEFLQVHGDTSPNFVINISQWHGCADKFLEKFPNRFNVFEYDDSNSKNNTLSETDIERLKHTTHCPAVMQNGKHAKNVQGDPITCDHCKRCYHKTKEVTAVYAH